jgi:hypothetical protein
VAGVETVACHGFVYQLLDRKICVGNHVPGALAHDRELGQIAEVLQCKITSLDDQISGEVEIVPVRSVIA